MSGKLKNSTKHLQWRLECLGHSWIEGLAGWFTAPGMFWLGEALGALGWHLMPQRRRVLMKNLRIAFAGEKDIDEIECMAKASFRRTAGNLMAAAHTARLAPEKLGRVISIENLELLEQALAAGKGVVLLLSHMGNWEILSRLIHMFPPGSRVGAFYRPLNNLLLDARVLARRQVDGTRMFSKRDSFHQVTGFLRQGGIVGILADQRVGRLGDPVSFFGRLTRASPLPSLLARRSKSEVLALSVTTESAGKWVARFMPVEEPSTTAHCMAAIEQAMTVSPVDVFWFQERWKVYLHLSCTIGDWLGPETSDARKPLRGLLWLAEVPDAWRISSAWVHPAVVYEVVLASDQTLPAWLPKTTRVHTVAAGADRGTLQKAIAGIDAGAALPLDFILTTGASKALVKAGRREVVPVVSLP
jgi:KDO2-lipid IV(A) lauroyltransferase